jgi:glycyl-tRNA synthetase beta chain
VGDLLLELLSEEIPARMQRRAIEELTALVRDKLAAAEIPAASLRGYVTPRRLTIVAEGIPARQPDRSEERRGPRVGAPQAALDGFLRAAGLESIGECETRDTGRGEFYFAVLQRPGRAAAEVLPELLHSAIAELPWPKSMRFPATTLRWVRPLVSVICLFDGAVLPLPLDDVPVGRTTRGHRFLSEGEIAVDNAADYLDRLEAAHVILDHDRRRDLIAADLDRLAAAEGLRVKPDPGLLDEVAGLVEFPVVLMGAIDEASMTLPPEVLATAMRTHQKYFSCLKLDGTPAPHFLFVANNKTPDDGQTIVAGNERVLRARLGDARFFWDQDRKIRLEDRVAALKERLFHADLGTMLEKVGWMQRVADFLVPHVDRALYHHSLEAVGLAKADLSAGMVGEFPELQGVMGRYYALYEGKDLRVADAIAEHYKPLGPNDNCPTAPDSIVVALADKIVTLYAFFAIGEEPTGSRDPFALRRAAQGIIRLVLENEIRLPLFDAFDRMHQALRNRYSNVSDKVLVFIVDRLKAHLRDSGLRHDVIAAARDPSGIAAEDDLCRLRKRAEALQAFLATEDGVNLLIAYRRASNIVRDEERKDGHHYRDDVDAEILHQPEELRLFRALSEVSDLARDAAKREDFGETMSLLSRLRQPVDAFFDRVTVNTEDPIVRQNRLRLLARIEEIMKQVADFSKILG